MSVLSLGQDGILEKASILAWKIPQTEEPGELQPMEVTEELDMIQQLSPHAHTGDFTRKSEIPKTVAFGVTSSTHGTTAFNVILTFKDINKV